MRARDLSFAWIVKLQKKRGRPRGRRGGKHICDAAGEKIRVIDGGNSRRCCNSFSVLSQIVHILIRIQNGFSRNLMGHMGRYSGRIMIRGF